MATQTNVIVSKFLGLNWQDLVKGLVLTVITSVLTMILEAAQKCGFSCIDWKVVATVGGTTAVGYILKNWLSPSQITIQNPTKETVEAVKSGESVVKVTPTPTINPIK